MKNRAVNELKNNNYIFIKNFILSAFIGGGTAFLFFIFYLIISPSFTFTLIQMIGVIFTISLISGTVSVGGSYLDYFLIERGIDNNIVRLVIVFLATIITVGGISIVYSLFEDIFSFQPLLLIIGIGGFIIAAVALVIEHIFWNMRKKVLTLEIRNEYLEEITKKEKLLKETTKSLILSQERNRIARELHDSVSQGLNGVKYIVYSMRKKVELNDTTGLKSNIDDLEMINEETLKELKKMIYALKPSTLDKKGLSKALKIQCQLFSKRSDIKIDFEIENIKRLKPEQELAIYRLVQEALTNVQKHSGATQVDVNLKQLAEKVKLIIKDNGCGFSLDNIDGNGINNMKTRVFQNNGHINFDSKKGSGTTIEVEFDIIDE